ncbi:MAG TPA: hypothetical protein VF111_11470 [Thermoanaerobaculia bacterium]
MSTQKTEVTETPTPTQNHAEAALARVAELRAMRELIPYFAIPPDKNGFRRLANASTLPAEFVELTHMALSNKKALVRGESDSPAETRDLVAYGEAYAPLADELEAMAQFVRYSIAAAKGRAGIAALTTYALAQRLARQPEHADLVPHVADMRRALRKRTKAAALARKQRQAAAATPQS